MLHKSCKCDIRLETMWWRDQLKENTLLSYTKTVKSTSRVKDCLRCMRCIIHYFPPPSPYTSVWSILEHSSKCRIFENFVLQCSIQWWTHDKAVLTSLCRKELPTVTLKLFLPGVYKLITWSCLCLQLLILLTRLEDFSVRTSYLFQWTLAYLPLHSLLVCTQDQTEGNS